MRDGRRVCPSGFFFFFFLAWHDLAFCCLMDRRDICRVGRARVGRREDDDSIDNGGNGDEGERVYAGYFYIS